MKPKKRNWPDHIGIGRVMAYGDQDVTVVDVKAGPMLIDTSKFDQPSAPITGTLKLKIAFPDGTEQWMPPMDGDSFVKWCERQDASTTTPGREGS